MLASCKILQSFKFSTLLFLDRAVPLIKGSANDIAKLLADVIFVNHDKCFIMDADKGLAILSMVNGLDMSC